MKDEATTDATGNGNDDNTTSAAVGAWIEKPMLNPVYTERTWRYVGDEPPIAMIGKDKSIRYILIKFFVDFFSF